MTEEEIAQQEELDKVAAQKRDDDLTAKLEQLDQKVSANDESASTLAKLMQDPEVAAVLAAKQAGKSVQVSELVDQPGLDLDSIDYDTMDNKDMVLLLKKITADQVSATIGEALKPVTNSLDALNNHAQQQNKDSVMDEIAQVKKDRPDFDYYRTEVAEIYQQNPNLSVAESYDVAKKRKGLAPPEINTERPSSTTAPRPASASNPKNPIRGSRGFKNIVRNSKVLEALGKS